METTGICISSNWLSEIEQIRVKLSSNTTVLVPLMWFFSLCYNRRTIHPVKIEIDSSILNKGTIST